MKRYNKIIQGNRYEITVCDAGKTFLLWDATLQRVIADSNNADELIIYAQKNNMINSDAVVMG